MGKSVYVIYDDRAAGGDTDEASVLEAGSEFSNDEAAKRWARKGWGEYAYALYAYVPNDKNELIGERLVEVHYPR